MICHFCKKEHPVDKKPGFRESCFHCGEDLHICHTCNFYDPGSYNECKEPVADRVKDKERSNLCEYYQTWEGNGANADSNDDALKKLEDLFKK